MRKYILACLLMLTVFVVPAVGEEYELPAGPTVALAQLLTLPGYQLICERDTESADPCNVPAGDYHLVVFDSDWQATHSDITIAAATAAPVPSITLVTESCFGGPNSREGCRASCPSGTVATGGACDVSDGFTVTSIAGENNYTCSAALTPNNQELGITASVYCMSLR